MWWFESIFSSLNMKRVAFEGQILEMNVKSLRSLDKSAWLKIEFNAEDDNLISKINELHKADKTVFVVISENITV